MSDEDSEYSPDDIAEGAGVEPRADMNEEVNVELRRFENQWGEYTVRFEMPEFRLNCPINGDAEQAKLTVEYVPGDWLLEDASLIAYLKSFSNKRVWNEAAASMIRDDIEEAILPKDVRVTLELETHGDVYTSVEADLKNHKYL